MKAWKLRSRPAKARTATCKRRRLQRQRGPARAPATQACPPVVTRLSHPLQAPRRQLRGPLTGVRKAAASSLAARVQQLQSQTARECLGSGMVRPTWQRHTSSRHLLAPWRCSRRRIMASVLPSCATWHPLPSHPRSPRRACPGSSRTCPRRCLWSWLTLRCQSLRSSPDSWASPSEPPPTAASGRGPWRRSSGAPSRWAALGCCWTWRT
mmetsp:Transcript_121341/g.354696  ORF Transcript_121341/g.354696 Transcript_121341/m.354696 type:complete len:210 (-) Transcript_121341:257-886(-)